MSRKNSKSKHALRDSAGSHQSRSVAGDPYDLTQLPMSVFMEPELDAEEVVLDPENSTRLLETMNPEYLPEELFASSDSENPESDEVKPEVDALPQESLPGSSTENVEVNGDIEGFLDELPQPSQSSKENRSRKSLTLTIENKENSEASGHPSKAFLDEFPQRSQILTEKGNQNPQDASTTSKRSSLKSTKSTTSTNTGFFADFNSASEEDFSEFNRHPPITSSLFTFLTTQESLMDFLIERENLCDRIGCASEPGGCEEVEVSAEIEEEENTMCELILSTFDSALENLTAIATHIVSVDDLGPYLAYEDLNPYFELRRSKSEGARLNVKLKEITTPGASHLNPKDMTCEESTHSIQSSTGGTPRRPRTAPAVTWRDVVNAVGFEDMNLNQDMSTWRRNIHEPESFVKFNETVPADLEIPEEVVRYYVDSVTVDIPEQLNVVSISDVDQQRSSVVPITSAQTFMFKSKSEVFVENQEGQGGSAGSTTIDTNMPTSVLPSNYVLDGDTSDASFQSEKPVITTVPVRDINDDESKSEFVVKIAVNPKPVSFDSPDQEQPVIVPGSEEPKVGFVSPPVPSKPSKNKEEMMEPAISQNKEPATPNSGPISSKPSQKMEHPPVPIPVTSKPSQKSELPPAAAGYPVSTQPSKKSQPAENQPIDWIPDNASEIPSTAFPASEIPSTTFPASETDGGESTMPGSRQEGYAYAYPPESVPVFDEYIIKYSTEETEGPADKVKIDDSETSPEKSNDPEVIFQATMTEIQDNSGSEPKRTLNIDGKIIPLTEEQSETIFKSQMEQLAQNESVVKDVMTNLKSLSQSALGVSEEQRPNDDDTTESQSVKPSSSKKSKTKSVNLKQSNVDTTESQSVKPSSSRRSRAKSVVRKSKSATSSSKDKEEKD